MTLMNKILTTIVIYLRRKNFDRFIVIDKVLGLTDKSNDFSIFWLFVKSLAASLCIYLYYLPDKIYLADDSVADRDF